MPPDSLHRVEGWPMSVMSLTTTPATPRSETRASCSPAAGGAVHEAVTGGTEEVPGLGLGNGATAEGVAPALAEAAGEEDAAGECDPVVELPPQAASARIAATA